VYQLLKDRTEAGKLLAGSLINYKNATDTIVLALPRGGVPVAYEISMKLNLPMDLVIVRKLGHPGHEEYAMGAITFGDIFYINPDVAYKIDINAPDIQAIIKKERQEYFRRNQLYRNNKPMPDVKGKRIILVDDGVATGSSIIAAIMALKELSPKEIVVAVPILPPDTLSNLKSLVTKVIFLYTPEPFGSVGSWYEDFPQTEDDEVIKLCAKANK